ncbi:MAG: MFS transporter [Cumulibacter sp.]
MTLPGFPPAGGGERSSGSPRESYGAGETPAGGNRARHDSAYRGRGERGPAERGRSTADDSPREPHPTEARTGTGRGARMLEATRVFTKTTARRIDDVSRADGAEKTGLRTLIWSNALSMGGDAFVTVYLAATLFFAAPGEQQRSNVALYLLVTVAPFAVIAPVIGPLLDRIDRGRRVAIAATYALRAVLCYLLAVNTDSTVVLYICALLLLVFSRAFNVLRAAVVPRVLPDDMPLVTANSRLNVFGVCGAGALGGVGVALMNVFNFFEPSGDEQATLGFTIELIVGALVFLLGAWLALRLPARVDTDQGEGKVAMSARGDGGSRERKTSSGVRIVLGTHVVTALRSSSVQKFLGGFLTFFMVFYIQSTIEGFSGLVALGALGAAAGVGSLIGVSLGTRFATTSPDRLVLIASGVLVACSIFAAVTPGVVISIIVALIAAILSALGKIGLDAIIQREIPEDFRSSAFSRSETMLQLAWVFGGTVGILLPTSEGQLWVGWTVATVLMSVAFGLTLWARHKAHQGGAQQAAVQPKIRSNTRFAIGRNRRDKDAETPPGRQRRRTAPPRPSDERPRAGSQRSGSGDPRPERQRRQRAESEPASAPSDDNWLSTPAPDARRTKALPDFRAAGLRPPPSPRDDRPRNEDA